MSNTQSKPPSFEALQVVFGVNSVWHLMAAYYFMFRGHHTLNMYAQRPFAGILAQDVLRWLGAINLPFVGLSVWGIRQLATPNKRAQEQREQAVSADEWLCDHVDAKDFWILSMANLSQFIIDLISVRSRNWKRNIWQLTIVDGVVAIVNACAAFYVHKRKHRLAQRQTLKYGTTQDKSIDKHKKTPTPSVSASVIDADGDTEDSN